MGPTVSAPGGPHVGPMKFDIWDHATSNHWKFLSIQQLVRGNKKKHQISAVPDFKLIEAIIGSDNGLSPGQHQEIIWTNAGILLGK